MPEIAANPLAVEKIASRIPVASPLNSAEWADLPIALRDRAQFSATVESMRLMQRVQDRIEQAIGQIRNERSVVVNEAQFVAEMQKIARDEGLDPRNLAATSDRFGGIQDITSEKRLKLIYRTQVQMMNEYARWRKAQDPAVLAAWPAQEFIRVQARRVPRMNWPVRFARAGGKLVNGRMVALLNDRVWRSLSVFGNPYPPFDYGSGMGLRSLSRREAEALGLIKPGEVPKSAFEEFNAHLQASVTDLNQEYLDDLKKIFGDQIEIEKGVVKWVASRAETKIVPSGLETTLPPLDLGGDPAAVPPIRLAQPPAAAASNALGSKISLAAQLPDGLGTDAASFQDGLTTIDGVHGDGPLTPIPFNHRVGEKMIGTYWTNRAGDEAISIGVLPGIDDTEFGLAHEVGHWLDNIGIPSSSKFASESGAPELQAWLEAVRETDAYQRVVAGENLSPDYHAYLMQPNEFWARAYAQFIAEESNDPAMLASLQKVVSGNFPGLPAMSQWSTEDFAAVRAAIRALFIKLGWILPPGI
jgi:hypothetical protein